MPDEAAIERGAWALAGAHWDELGPVDRERARRLVSAILRAALEPGDT